MTKSAARHYPRFPGLPDLAVLVTDFILLKKNSIGVNSISRNFNLKGGLRVGLN